MLVWQAISRLAGLIRLLKEAVMEDSLRKIADAWLASPFLLKYQVLGKIVYDDIRRIKDVERKKRELSSHRK